MDNYQPIQAVPMLLLSALASLFWPGHDVSLLRHVLSSSSPAASPSHEKTIASSDITFRVYLPAVIQPSAADEILRLTNQVRAQNGCGPLTLSPALSAAAHMHSADMAANDFVGHTGTDGSTLRKRLDEVGYDFTLAAENVAGGYSTPQEVVQVWYNETPPNDGHRRNILNCKLQEIGVGQAYNSNSTYRFYWTQDFGTQ